MINPAAQRMYAQKHADDNTRVRVGVGIVIRNVDGLILLERRSDNGLWGLPGGRIEPGESIVQTALREAKEETGLTVAVTRLMGVYSGPEERIVTFPDNVVQLLDIMLEAQIVAGELACSSESSELQFFHPSAFPPEAEIVPPAKLPLRDIAAGLCGVVR